MLLLGYMLLIIGALAAAFTTSLDPATLPWGYYAVAMVVGAVGLVMVKRHQHLVAHDPEQLEENLGQLNDALGRIVMEAEQLVDRRHELPVHEYRFEIDRLFRADLNQFAEARYSIRHSCGVQVFADVMSPFAAGERYINRIWSASADGYLEEANTYLVRALEQFREARAKLTAALATVAIKTS
ncbi:hypothetical protein EZV61_00510 [Corallincola luteus]|uniref:DUF4760 domain-containing protein n=1 Tax=Corallincola luteus TaxID=1775177 RepID=A0ABY2ANL9_9GAMM|nr:hypothetical protein [Corallincola luteus]TCI04494.1 hypothetical protein EZV61_00510 [Corallincola luteus]